MQTRLTRYLENPELFEDEHEVQEFALKFDRAARGLANAILGKDSVRTQNSIQATEVVNEAFIAVREKFPDVPQTTNEFLHYLAAIICNYIRSIHRRMNAKKRSPEGGISHLVSDPQAQEESKLERVVDWLEEQLKTRFDEDPELKVVMILGYSGESRRSIESITGINRKKVRRLLEQGNELLALAAADCPWIES